PSSGVLDKTGGRRPVDMRKRCASSGYPAAAPNLGDGSPVAMEGGQRGRMSKRWAQVTKAVTAAMAIGSLLLVGCGPAPGYESEVAYPEAVLAPPPAPPPPSSEELASRAPVTAEPSPTD